ncbi:galactose-specific lectin nattectin-like [Sebastes umbrosus]|uniref:galactose-specific lectin nattectin-like n=1 Tax=Sebastes umbrosus TaxID=72105 RepID=UPI00189DF35A|nr:galactose-specific lectin nattectin-like [Sebastes umbrosus]XP_037615155.1 galactose-specific lectin nattectin-like [Sebastes umbrosus]
MRPAVVTAVLLLVCVLNAVTAQPGHTRTSPSEICERYPDKPCGDGWSYIAENRCVKHFDTPKVYAAARYHCITIKSSPVSIHSEDELNNLLCLTWRLNPELQPFWIGARKSGLYNRRFTYFDQTPFDFEGWYRDEPDNATRDEDCIESNFKDWGYWNDVSCSEMRNFVCAKTV